MRGEVVWGGMGLIYALGMDYARITGKYIECDLEAACEKMGVPLNAVSPSSTLGEAFERALVFKACQKLAESNREK